MKIGRIVVASVLLCLAATARAQNCVDIEGEWEITERATVRCCIGGTCDSFTDEASDFVFFEQDGCRVSYVVPATGTERSGRSPAT